MPRTPSSRRAFVVGPCGHPRLGAACRAPRFFGLAMLISGVAFRATWIGQVPILSVIGFVVMFGGVVFAITGPRVAGGRDRAGAEQGGQRQKRSKGGGSFTSRMEDRFRRRSDE